jgi:FixJ family two-component response regulator
VNERAPTIFVVDDDASVRRGLDRLLRAAGYRVATFVSARELLEHGELDRADCLVLDVRMPGQGGFDLQQELTALGHAIPIIFITGHGEIPIAVRAIKSGAVDFLAKPFDDRTLLDAVEQALGRDGPERRDDADRQEIRPPSRG